MASSPSPRSISSLGNTLLYFSKYDYPLTSHELWFWQHGTKSISPSSVPPLKLRGGKGVIFKNGDQLSKIKFIEAIFVTGSLAMSNCTPEADIDLMIITSPATLWLTRILVYLSLRSLRRKPQVISAPDKICDNLYLDMRHLSISPPDLYRAHEVLQAKCLFDRGGVYHKFLLSNSWVEKYLPVAYRETLQKIPVNMIHNSLFIIQFILWPLNLLAFVLQFAYMRSKMTTERVGLGYAFFHPQSPM
ncbi:nucleotidyltransferase domain-containing protein [Candidatus Amesbacteria bacterium]|nr:nucleotidyltransferase domain-containing protein [Candidatus Amesbacteria bacterium]